MPKKIINLLVLVPLAIILVVLCVANRQAVTLALNPFRPDDSLLSFSAPFFVFIFLSLILGIVLGSMVTWFSQGKYRKRARTEAKEAVRWHDEANRHKAAANAVVATTPTTTQIASK
ncbi:putative integral membrane protein [Rhizobium skierniewicense]|uniref:Putative integral membrane protein n=1 Tax=Rhizobium skierniewicense TaxID=984260 RepID=A0A7W6C6Q6_9HYPH|nr:lipopolysaccharide assembly protein LapA domain-containing protein [Rhizobium skierniewicense]MBB3946780.1 putative integral membrane protein [Rhizobium skierniewicense]NTF30561.1 LapA family protein [Rhizobium skierniewicense]